MSLLRPSRLVCLAVCFRLSLIVLCLPDDETIIDWRKLCRGLYPRVFTNYAPRGNLSAGIYTNLSDVRSINRCVESCCKLSECNVALTFNRTCYHVRCRSSELCLPLFRPERASVDGSPSMVLVRSLEDDESWNRFFDQTSLAENQLTEDHWENSLFSSDSGKSCIVKTDCAMGQLCVRRRDAGGLLLASCRCAVDYGTTSGDESCSSLTTAVTTSTATTTTVLSSVNSLQSALPKRLHVSAVSKEIRLPENEVTLSAYTVPDESNDERYTYAWSLLSQPEGHTGTMADQNRVTVKLSNLSEGLYAFKVSVNGSHAYGEAYANVSVLPPKRINRPPTAVVTPAAQIVKLPNTGAVLDGSASKDDDRVVAYHWELQRGPIGYKPTLVDTPTLQLDRLIPGNYTFKLTVQDSDGSTDSTTANITVLKDTDYPPSANAGQDVIIYLPQNALTLNGNQSTDDRGIVSWEWTKSPSDQNKAVDMRDTRTPYLKLSGLEEGMYTFVLKVIDDSEQSSTAEVRVFVKPPTNQPPKADAGDDLNVVLPDDRATLNGTKSRDDVRIVSYRWEQIAGPNLATFSNANRALTNVTHLTKGRYEFKLTVVDDAGNRDSDIVRLRVTQTKNAPPTADAGGDMVLVAPVPLLFLNGSRSNDDLKIDKWCWTRDPSSLAIGTVLPGTDKSPVLMLTDVVPGRYVFRLAVTDEQGLTGQDTVSIIVKPDPLSLRLVELTLDVGASVLTESQKNSLLLKLQMLLRDDATIVVRHFREEPRTGRAVLVFYAEKKGGERKTTIPGPEVVQRLREKLSRDSGLLRLSVVDIDTAVCQNSCSGHGVCDQETRRCLCEAFWMQNLLQRYFGNGDSNCDWSVLYVMIALLSLLVSWVACAWGLARLCQKMCADRRRSLRSNKKPPRYSLLRAPDVKDDALTRNGMTLSESDTDSDDVLFEHRRGRIGGTRPKNVHSRNGFSIAGSKIKA